MGASASRDKRAQLLGLELRRRQEERQLEQAAHAQLQLQLQLQSNQSRTCEESIGNASQSDDNSNANGNDDECPICTESKTLITLGCRHRVCGTCLQSHAETEIGNRRREINCVVCHVTIDDIDLRRHVPSVVERLDCRRLQVALDNDIAFVYCAHGCGFGQYLIGNYNWFTCSRCGQKTCIQHRVQMHTGQTCAQFDAAQIQQPDLSASWIRKNTKSCPGCNQPIEKNNGCDAMRHCVYGNDRCRRAGCDHGGHCGQAFCWQCLAKFDGTGMRQHKKGCRHFTGH
jgi:hypothetical protein